MPNFRILGVTLASNFSLPKRTPLPPNIPADLSFSRSVVESLPWDSADMLPVYESPYRFRDGKSLLYVYRQYKCDLFRFTNCADFYLWPDRIVCHQLQDAYPYEVGRWLGGTVLAVWLERKGIPVFHASAVVVDDSGVVFLGSNTAGKSSLALALMQSGFPLLTDDALPIERRDNFLMGQPGCPEMRLWPDLAQYFLGHFEDLDLVHPDVTKRTLPIGPHGFGSFCDLPRPVRCLYIPIRRDPDETGAAVEIAPVSPGDALIELVRYSFSTQILTALGLQSQRLNSLAQIARQLPLRKLWYPSGLEYLPAVRDTILKDIRALPH